MKYQESFIPKIGDGWTLFLDRDGVINKRNMDGYILNWEAFEFLPGVLDALAIARAYFDRFIMITNQQGVGKELMTREDILDIHEKMSEEIAVHGGIIDEIFTCEALSTDFQNCRKPSPEMAFLAKDAFPDIRFNQSVMVGDTSSDMEFGHNVKMNTVLVNNNHKYQGVKPDLIFDGLPEFIEAISLYHGT